MKRPLLVMSVMLVASGTALARPTTVALTRFDGDDDGIGKAVAAALDDNGFETVPAKRVRRTMRKLELSDDPSDQELEKLAGELEVDAVVTGKVERSGHRLRLRVYTAATKSKPFSVAVTNVKSAKFRKLVHAKVSEKIAAVLPADDDAAKPGKSNTQRAPEAKQVAEAEPAVDDREVPADPARITVAAKLAAPVHSANRAAVRLDAGSSFMARDFRFATTRAFDNAPHPYATKALPGARLDAELYPFAFGDPTNALAGIGVGVDFDQTAALALHPVTDPTIAVKTTQRSYSAGVRYRIAFGSAPTSPTLTLGAGYGRRTFAVSAMNAAELDLPGIDDKLVDPQVAFRLPLGSSFAVTLGGRALVIMSGGPIENADQYGHATMFGGEASLGVEIVIRDRLALRVTGEATQIDYRFSGTGMLATSRDGDPSTIDVKSATDRYIGGTATLAVMY